MPKTDPYKKRPKCPHKKATIHRSSTDNSTLHFICDKCEKELPINKSIRIPKSIPLPLWPKA